jgi:hypothetical protein
MIKNFNSNTVVIWPILLLFFIIPIDGFCNPDPPFNLIIRWKNPSDTLIVDKFRNDEDICCDFSITLVKADTCFTEVVTSEGVSIGMIWGNCSPGFIKYLTPKFFEAKYDLDRKRNLNLVVGG